MYESQKRYGKSLKGKITRKKYKQSDKGKIVNKRYKKKYLHSVNGKTLKQKYDKKYSKNNPEKIKAQNFINNLLQNSDFTRDICTICGKSNTEFHHENYDLPYFGYWFCVEHHKEIHNIKGV